MVGVLLGVGASLAVVMYIKGGDSPFSELSNNKKPLATQIAEDAKKRQKQNRINSKTALNLIFIRYCLAVKAKSAQTISISRMNSSSLSRNPAIIYKLGHFKQKRKLTI